MAKKVHELFTPHRTASEQSVRVRVLPVQPDGTPQGYLFVGSDLGFIPFSGNKPTEGDLIAVQGGDVRRFVGSPAAGDAMRWPTFELGCNCRCPSPRAVAFFLTFGGVQQIIAFDVQTGAIGQLFGQKELRFFGAASAAGIGTQIGIAADPDNKSLWVLDDRRNFAQLKHDLNPSPHRAYWALLKYVVMSGQYTLNQVVELTDSFTPFSDMSGYHIEPLTETQAPGSPPNCLSILGNEPYLTIEATSATYLRLIGGTTESFVTLLQGGTPYPATLIGNIVSLPDRSGKLKNRRVVLAVNRATSHYFLLQFTDNLITQTIDLGIFSGQFVPNQLLQVCNQIYVYVSSQAGIDAILPSPAELMLIDSCKGFRISKRFSLQPPLNTAVLEGIAPTGCKPAISHRRMSDTNATLVSQINRAQGTFQKDYAIQSNPFSDTVANTYPTHSPYLGGFVGDNPIVGTQALPFPLTLPLITGTVTHLIDGLPLNSGSTLSYNGFARTAFDVNRPYYLIEMPGEMEFYDGTALVPGSIGLENYKVYRIYTRVTVTGGSPLTLMYLQPPDVPVAGYIWPDTPSGSYAAGQLIEGDIVDNFASGDLYTMTFKFFSVSPAFLTDPGSAFILGPSNYPTNGTDLQREAVWIFHEEATMPAFGGDFSRTYDNTIGRNKFIVYASPSVEIINLNGIAGIPYTGSAPLSHAVTGPFATASTYPQCFTWNFPVGTNDFTVEVFAFGGRRIAYETFPGSHVLLNYNAGGGNTVYEGICLVVKQHFVNGSASGSPVT